MMLLQIALLTKVIRKEFFYQLRKRAMIVHRRLLCRSLQMGFGSDGDDGSFFSLLRHFCISSGLTNVFPLVIHKRSGAVKCLPTWPLPNRNRTWSTFDHGSPAWAAYEEAVQDHEREVERLKAECGVTAAHELEDATSEAVNQVRDALAETPATTIAGLIFKARYAAAHYRTEYDIDVMLSIVDDLLAMAEEGEGGADV